MDPKDKINFREFLKNADIQPTESGECQNSKRMILEICRYLGQDSNMFSQRKCERLVENYINDENKLDRMLYSVITNFIFSLDSNERGTYFTNLDAMLGYVTGKERSTDLEVDVKKIVIKIYDHSNLAVCQMDNVRDTISNAVDEVKERTLKEIRNNTERDYIAILGIFASIVLTFVGGLSFTTAAVENVANANIFRLIAVIDIVGLVLTNVIYLLLKFMFDLLGRKMSRNFIIAVNVVYIVILAGVVTARSLIWYYGQCI